jgi:hypothetical protein
VSPARLEDVLREGWRGERLELERARLEPYKGKLREVYRPKGLFAFAAGAREYVEIL